MERGERGFTYLGLLIAIAILGIGLVAASDMWSSSVRHQRLVQLDWIGGQFTEAIGSYYHSSPGTLKQYPATLAELLEDKRFLTVRRHLRRVYVHPVTGLREWELVRGADGRIVGVRAEVPMPDRPLVREYRWVPS